MSFPVRNPETSKLKIETEKENKDLEVEIEENAMEKGSENGEITSGEESGRTAVEMVEEEAKLALEKCISAEIRSEN